MPGGDFSINNVLIRFHRLRLPISVSEELDTWPVLLYT